MKAMTRDMKTPKIVLLMMALVVLLTSVAVVFAQDKIELGVTWWGSQNRHDRTIKVIEMYEAEHPNVDITYEFVGWTDYWTKVNTQAAGGNLACVMQQDYAYLTEWASRGLLVPLDDYLSAGTIDASNISQSVIDSGKVDGKVYGLSLGTNSQTYILDADAFAKAGVDLPPKDWTWDDFASVSEAIHDKLGIWGIAYGPWDDANIKSLLISSGQWLFNADGTAIGITDPTPVINHLDMIKKLMDDGAIASMDLQADFTAAGLEGSPIIEGKEAMRYQWSNQVVALETAAGEGRNFVLYPMPRVDGGVSPNYLKPSQFFSITKDCANPDEAAKFIDYFTNNADANDVLFGERGVPVSSIIRDHLAAEVDPTTKSIFDYIAEVSQDASPVPPPDPVGYGDLNNNVLAPQFVEPVLYGVESAQDGYNTFVTEADAILAKNK
ncbi:MAG: extracellular solute-binding protein [Chloroflexi bacterium]|nr:extracellular solute-binding protein [Chloroflexota bacterium]